MFHGGRFRTCEACFGLDGHSRKSQCLPYEHPEYFPTNSVCLAQNSSWFCDINEKNLRAFLKELSVHCCLANISLAQSLVPNLLC